MLQSSTILLCRIINININGEWQLTCDKYARRKVLPSIGVMDAPCSSFDMQLLYCPVCRLYNISGFSSSIQRCLFSA